MVYYLMIGAQASLCNFVSILGSDFRAIDAFESEPRLILHSILHCRFGDLLALVGVLCSTWVSVNVGTSQRDVLTPMGHPEYPSVQSANTMVSRLG